MNIGQLLARDAVIYGGADFLSRTVAFITFPLIAAFLSPAGFGALELLLTVASLLSVLASMGLNSSIHRFYWDGEMSEDLRPVLVSTGAIMLAVLQAGVIAVGMAAFALLGATVLADGGYVDWLGVLAALVMMAATQLTQFMLDVARLHRAAWRFFAVSLAGRVATALTGVAALLFLKLGLDGMLVLQATVAVAVVPFAFAAVSRDIVPRFDWSFAGKLLRYGHPLVYASMAFWLVASIDRWMLAVMSTVAEVGVYSAALRFASIAAFVSTAFAMAWTPVAIKLKTDHPTSYRNIYGDVLVALGALMLPVGAALALFAPEILVLAMPSEYWDAASPLAVLSLGLVLQSTTQITAVAISIEKRTGLFAILAWLTAGINALLNLAFVPLFGALGAAWGTTISYVFLSAIYLVISRQLNHLALRVRRLSILGATWLGLVAIAGSALPAFGLIERLAVFVVCVAVCAAVVPWRNRLFAE